VTVQGKDGTVVAGARGVIATKSDRAATHTAPIPNQPAARGAAGTARRPARALPLGNLRIPGLVVSKRGRAAAGSPRSAAPRRAGTGTRTRATVVRDGHGTCRPGATCSFSCTRGGCRHLCQRGSTCTAACPGGRCTQTCETGAACTFTCAGGACQRTCAPRSTCRQTCAGGRCR
jgi:hypothetical protein